MVDRDSLTSGGCSPVLKGYLKIIDRRWDRGWLFGVIQRLTRFFATIVVGIVETVQIIDQRSGPPSPGPEGWMLVRTVVRDPVDRPPFLIQDIFLNTAELVSLGEVVWFEEIFYREKVRLFQPGQLGTL